ncbi:hypothetical protein [Aquariibacter albus]|uniref:Uncharacterized protein n=1 Tax=Aquariibacter albus TaxID=2759899 RepID=A0A839HV29_9BURK|nr:hypothetical protein [Aquariibacter albus]MBB1162224.1 hypothetical protein [Aquariibacter albus]
MSPGPALRWLVFSLSEGSDGVLGLEAEAASRDPAEAAAIATEAAGVLAWAAEAFPEGPGPVEDGADWDQALSQREEPGGWQHLALSLSASPRFLDAFVARFGDPQAD